MMALMLVYLIDLEDYDGLLGPGSMAAGAINCRPIPRQRKGVGRAQLSDRNA
jgi:hypothetical protein